MTLANDTKENKPKWAVSGVAGFIGSNILHSLLSTGEKVIGLDNFSTGKRDNLEDVRRLVGEEKWRGFEFIEGDICDLESCRALCRGADIVLHQAALGSVPRSIKDPLATHRANVDGFINMLSATVDQKACCFVYASSSSVYGDNPDLPKIESKTGRPLSPYAASKCIDEIYAGVFSQVYGLKAIGLRYFNVFGPRQDPNGPYAAVIPRWIGRLLNSESCVIYGDGKTSRDFCYVENVVEANLQAAKSALAAPDFKHAVLNIGRGDTTSLTDLYEIIKSEISRQSGREIISKLEFEDFRTGDIRHSLASIDQAKKLIGYSPQFDVRSGINKTVAWYLEKNRS